jgi:hypothetical protein
MSLAGGRGAANLFCGQFTFHGLQTNAISLLDGAFPLIDPPGAPLLKNQCSFLWQFCDEKSNYTFMKNHKKIIKKITDAAGL